MIGIWFERRKKLLASDSDRLLNKTRQLFALYNVDYFFFEFEHNQFPYGSPETLFQSHSFNECDHIVIIFLLHRGLIKGTIRAQCGIEHHIGASINVNGH